MPFGLTLGRSPIHFVSNFASALVNSSNLRRSLEPELTYFRPIVLAIVQFLERLLGVSKTSLQRIFCHWLIELNDMDLGLHRLEHGVVS